MDVLDTTDCTLKKLAMTVHFVFCTFLKEKLPLPSLHILRQEFHNSMTSSAPIMNVSQSAQSLSGFASLHQSLCPSSGYGVCLFMVGCGGLECPSPFFANLCSVDSSDHSQDRLTSEWS